MRQTETTLPSPRHRDADTTATSSLSSGNIGWVMATLVLATSAAAQTSWRQLSPGTSPPARHARVLAYNSANDRVLLFGGNVTSGTALGDTWEWDGANWNQRNPATNPSPRINHTLTYDAARNRIVMFGGGVGGILFAETWQWDGTNWSQLNPAMSPPPRSQHAMAYDSLRGRSLALQKQL